MDENIRGTVSHRLRSAREDAGILQKQLAREVGVSQSAVSNWEKGIRDLTSTQVVKLCRALDVTPDYLFGFTTLKNQGKALEQAMKELETR